MNSLDVENLGSGITCIDAHYVKQGLACFYLLEGDGEYAVIETGTSHSVSQLTRLLDARGVHPEQVRYIIPTHVHLDHAGGAGMMMSLFPRATLLVHPRGARHMADPGRLIEASRSVYGDELFEQLYGEIRPIDNARIHVVDDGETVHLGERALLFRHTRGHAEHHACIWDATSRGWFSGDMFGVSYPWCRFSEQNFLLPSTTPSQFDPVAFANSIDVLESYKPRYMYLTHFGRLDYAPQTAALLRRQVQDYCEMARDYGDDAERLQSKLSEYSLALLRDIGGAESAVFRAEALAFDLQLNAQGLQAWLRSDRLTRA